LRQVWRKIIAQADDLRYECEQYFFALRERQPALKVLILTLRVIILEGIELFYTAFEFVKDAAIFLLFFLFYLLFCFLLYFLFFFFTGLCVILILRWFFGWRQR
jgi:hypothetical protein